MRLILLGAPGAGKGTQAKLLEKQLHVKHISMGDILREEMKNNTALGQEVKKYVESGGLVPDEVVTKIIENRFQDPSIAQAGYLLDGFPRTAKQAEDLDVILTRINQPVDYVVYMEVDSEVVIQRLTGRRVCRSCAALYHVKNMPSKQEGICDACQGELYQRPDDNEETIRKRINVYLESTTPIIDYYKKKGTLLTVDGNTDAEKLRDELLTIFKEDGKIDTSKNKK
ncbi:MAG TPA: adenylate kinase [Candidatus Omnitrophota bacterium]|nr:adenylate kinase [Candidatus Omnitrophota bacterium]